MVGLDGEEISKHEEYLPMPARVPYAWPPSPSNYKYGSKRVCRNISGSRALTNRIVEWTTDNNEQGIRRMLKELKGGSAIEVSAFAKSPWLNHVLNVTIEVKWAVVTRM
jgi:hypothetical protein